MDGALHDAVVLLLIDGLQDRVVGDGLVGLRGQVRGTPALGGVALQGALLAGEVLGQQVQRGGLGRIGLGLDAHQLEAEEAAQVIGLAVHLEGGQVGHAHVVAQDGFDVLGGPGAGHDDGGAVGEGGSLRAGHMDGGGDQLLHALGGDQALVAVEGVVHLREDALVVGVPLGDAAGAEEEGSQIPGGGLHLEGEVLAGGFAVGDQLLQGFHVFLVGDDGLVIIHEVAVVRGERIGEHAAVRGGHGLHGVRVGVLLHGLHGPVAQLGQGAGLHQTGELVLREAEDVAAGLDVGHHLGRGVALTHRLDGGVELDAVLVRAVEVLDLLAGEVHDLVGHPHLDVIFAGQAFRRSGDGQGQQHGGCQHQGKNPLHTKILLCFVCSDRCENISCGHAAARTDSEKAPCVFGNISHHNFHGAL